MLRLVSYRNIFPRFFPHGMTTPNYKTIFKCDKCVTERIEFMNRLGCGALLFSF